MSGSSRHSRAFRTMTPRQFCSVAPSLRRAMMGSRFAATFRKFFRACSFRKSMRRQDAACRSACVAFCAVRDSFRFFSGGL
jgi:hypothetical protein